MAKKSLGYVELEWHCPGCSTRNPGPQKTCLNCGLPQPDDIKFEQPDQEEFVTDEAKLANIHEGADIHCRYCGSRNSASAKACSQCGADLSEGTKRESGQVLGDHRSEPAEKIDCPACGRANDANAPNCMHCGSSLIEPRPEAVQPKPRAIPAKKSSSRRFGIYGIAALALLILAACITFFVIFSRTEDSNGIVEAVSWERTIAIEELVPVTREDWQDQIPAEAVVGACTEKTRGNESRFTGRTREVCGDPYTVDKGNGLGEVIQDCVTEDIMESVPVYASSCQYTINVWQQLRQERLSGNDLSPRWPDVSVTRNQRQGQRNESYQCIFNTEGGQFTYSTNDENLYNQCKIGSRWVLQINSFDVVMGIQPLN